MKPEVILVTGSRNWTDRTCIARCFADHPPGTILIHGGCRGADKLAAAEGKYRSFVIWELPYFEDDNGKEARNASMCIVAASLRDIGHKVTCYAWPLEESVGTFKCMKQMRAAALRIANWENQ